MIKLSTKHQKGFTIVELLAATSIFALVLLVVSYTVIQIARTYNKGITETRTQDVARKVLDRVVEDIQFGGKPINVPDYSHNQYSICIGNNRYSVNRTVELKDGATFPPHALVLDAPSELIPQDSCDPNTWIDHLDGTVALPKASPNATTPPQELLSPQTRILELKVTTTTADIYQVHLKIAAGDDDLFCNPDPPSNCGSSTATDFNRTDLSCRIGAGSEFCDIVMLDTTAKIRTQ